MDPTLTNPELPEGTPDSAYALFSGSAPDRGEYLGVWDGNWSSQYTAPDGHTVHIGEGRVVLADVVNGRPRVHEGASDVAFLDYAPHEWAASIADPMGPLDSLASRIEEFLDLPGQEGAWAQMRAEEEAEEEAGNAVWAADLAAWD